MDERAEIEAATERLLDGLPLRSDGKLTIVSLATEAGVKRHVLTHKHTDLKDRFNARVKAQHAIPASETALREQNDELRRRLDGMRAERDEYKQAADALARALNVLTVENDELRRKARGAGQLTGPRPLAQLRRPTGVWFHAAAPCQLQETAAPLRVASLASAREPPLLCREDGAGQTSPLTAVMRPSLSSDRGSLTSYMAGFGAGGPERIGPRKLGSDNKGMQRCMRGMSTLIDRGRDDVPGPRQAVR